MNDMPLTGKPMLAVHAANNRGKRLTDKYRQLLVERLILIDEDNAYHVVADNPRFHPMPSVDFKVRRTGNTHTFSFTAMKPPRAPDAPQLPEADLEGMFSEMAIIVRSKFDNAPDAAPALPDDLPEPLTINQAAESVDIPTPVEILHQPENMFSRYDRETATYRPKDTSPDALCHCVNCQKERGEFSTATQMYEASFVIPARPSVTDLSPIVMAVVQDLCTKTLLPPDEATAMLAATASRVWQSQNKPINPLHWDDYVAAFAAVCRSAATYEALKPIRAATNHAQTIPKTRQ